MYSRPNNPNRPFNYHAARPQYHGQQWQHPTKPPTNPTPYQYYAKPQQPANWLNYAQPNFNGYAAPNQKQASGLLNYFQDENGQMDFNKMMSTVGQVSNTVKQISPMVKQFSTIMKSFK